MTKHSKQGKLVNQDSPHIRSHYEGVARVPDDDSRLAVGVALGDGSHRAEVATCIDP